MARGVVHLVATPVGNLEDITLRALRILREADLVACEDTRHSGRLLHHFGIDRPLISCHEHNESSRAEEIAVRAADGARVALVSDAGTPGISDPGFRVVRAALARGVRVVPVPGPNAAIAALSASGLPTHRFLFVGFLPVKQSKRREALGAVRSVPATIILHEAPHRILDTLTDLKEVLGDRRVAVARELTKLHEEFLRGTVAEVLEELSGRPAVKGELVILVAPDEGAVPADTGSLAGRVDELERAGRPRMEAIKQAARERGIGKREAYAQLELGKPGSSATTARPEASERGSNPHGRHGKPTQPDP